MTTKKAYGLDLVAARLEDTTRTTICLAMPVFNLKKLLAAALLLFGAAKLSTIATVTQTLFCWWRTVTLKNQLIIE